MCFVTFSGKKRHEFTLHDVFDGLTRNITVATLHGSLSLVRS